jgi:hypothetical protein
MMRDVDGSTAYHPLVEVYLAIASQPNSRDFADWPAAILLFSFHNPLKCVSATVLSCVSVLFACRSVSSWLSN